MGRALSRHGGAASLYVGTAKTAEHNRVFMESLRAAIRADQDFSDGFYVHPRCGD